MAASVLVLVRPKASKLEETWKLVQWVSEQVQKHEPEVSAYRYWRTGQGDGTEYVIYFETASEDILRDRWSKDHHQEVKRQVEQGDLLKEPFRYRILRSEGGWRR
ncbi:uncharacterized protein AB675_11405 [Cyphellophora attinorum]|uniref:ABM domain-containing protein n=1 Tax=Cyphellophora attinorum TaxID=1664694 RepID=A0A0N1H468_9EURO|nr:uncharacterized protein AB675_11405 [Phialophora attinorum]KPI39942.1 hypothetical protein AB675_11405 [Phialophora attinorum]